MIMRLSFKNLFSVHMPLHSVSVCTDCNFQRQGHPRIGPEQQRTIMKTFIWDFFRDGRHISVVLRSLTEEGVPRLKRVSI